MNITRREFLKAAATSAAAFTILKSGSARTYAANEKLSIAAVGAGGRGASDIRHVDSQNIVALCDVDLSTEYVAEAKNRFPNAYVYDDWRKLFDNK